MNVVPRSAASGADGLHRLYFAIDLMPCGLTAASRDTPGDDTSIPTINVGSQNLYVAKDIICMARICALSSGETGEAIAKQTERNRLKIIGDLGWRGDRKRF